MFSLRGEGGRCVWVGEDEGVVSVLCGHGHHGSDGPRGRVWGYAIKGPTIRSRMCLCFFARAAALRVTRLCVS